ncbi:MAG: nitroreductase family protein [Chloroflexi bacterium]|nr:nitroreductase family protein [Chloroflexota bacterium]
MDVLEAIKTRRSIRRYKTTLVDDKVLEQVPGAARRSPSWANTQCWRFIVVCNDTLKTELASTLSTNNPSTNAIEIVPIVIVACAEVRKAGFYHGGPSTTLGDWFMFDIGLAMENTALAAHVSGLGGCAYWQF